MVEPVPTPPLDTAETRAVAPDASVDIALVNPDGLHARPAAALVARVSDFAAQVTVTNLRSGVGPASASSPIALATLAARDGDTLRIGASGTDAAAAVEAVRRLDRRGVRGDTGVVRERFRAGALTGNGSPVSTGSTRAGATGARGRSA